MIVNLINKSLLVQSIIQKAFGLLICKEIHKTNVLPTIPKIKFHLGADRFDRPQNLSAPRGGQI